MQLPADFVAANAALAYSSGASLFTGSLGGGRAWRVEEHVMMAESGRWVEELCWRELWQLDTVDPAEVLDVLKFLPFYTESIERFLEFDNLVFPLMKEFNGSVTQASEGGISIHFHGQLQPARTKKISDMAWDFNIKHFNCEVFTRASYLKSFRKTSELWFGPV